MTMNSIRCCAPALSCVGAIASSTQVAAEVPAGHVRHGGPAGRHRGRHRPDGPATLRQHAALPELIADAHRRAAAPVRQVLLERLLRPVGSLALAAIASGAFSAFLLRRVTLEDVARITADQAAELARFVAQRSPETLQQIRSMLA